MKRLIGSTIIAALGLVGNIQAAPLYYTFEGAIFLIEDSAGAIAAADGLGIGSSVSYTFLVDMELQGSGTTHSGSVETLADTPTSNFFFADFISGSMIDEVNGGRYNAPSDIAEYNVGAERVTSRMLGHLAGGSEDALITINSYDINFSNWVVGTSVTGAERVFDDIGYMSGIGSNLTLTSISGVSSVPEPASIILLGAGLAGLGFTRKMNKA
jgi:hypothetical protein